MGKGRGDLKLILQTTTPTGCWISLTLGSQVKVLTLCTIEHAASIK